MFFLFCFFIPHSPFACDAEEVEGDVAVAVGMLVEVVLMIGIGGVEVAEGFHFDDDGGSVLRLLLVDEVADDGEVGGVGVVDACAIAGAAVFALLVEARGVDGAEIEFEQAG